MQLFVAGFVVCLVLWLTWPYPLLIVKWVLGGIGKMLVGISTLINPATPAQPVATAPSQVIHNYAVAPGGHLTVNQGNGGAHVATLAPPLPVVTQAPTAAPTEVPATSAASVATTALDCQSSNPCQPQGGGEMVITFKMPPPPK